MRRVSATVRDNVAGSRRRLNTGVASTTESGSVDGGAGWEAAAAGVTDASNTAVRRGNILRAGRMARHPRCDRAAPHGSGARSWRVLVRPLRTDDCCAVTYCYGRDRGVDSMAVPRELVVPFSLIEAADATAPANTPESRVALGRART